MSGPVQSNDVLPESRARSGRVRDIAAARRGRLACPARAALARRRCC